VKKFDTGTMTLLDTVSSTILKAPHGLAISHDDQFLVAAGSVSEYLVKIKTSDFSIETSTPVDETVPPSGNGTNNFRPYQVVITNDNRYAMVSLSKSNQVRVYDLQNFMNLVTVINTGQYPLALEISPDGNICYVPNQLSNSVTVIDVNTFQVIKTINDIGVQPHMVDFTTEGRYALVTCESRTGSFIHHALQSSKRPGTTAVIDLSMGHIKVKDIEMASFPAGISILD
jgi:YVTN family beta-propeller protein